jgi:hypothetical protein
VDGLWSVAFSTRQGANYGVAVFIGDQLFGGDSAFYWTGSIKTQAGKIEAKLEGRSHSGHPVPSVLGGSVAQFTLDLAGPAPTASQVGASFTVSGSGVQAKITRRA